MVWASFSFIIFSMSPLLCAVADVATSDPTATANAPATIADSAGLDIRLPPVQGDFAKCTVAGSTGCSPVCTDVRTGVRKVTLAEQARTDQHMPVGGDVALERRT